MLRFFRLNDPYRLLVILLLMGCATAGFLLASPPVTIPELTSFLTGEAVNSGNRLYADILDTTPYLSATVYGWLDNLSGRSLVFRHILAALVLFVQAAFFSVLLIRNRAYNENTYLPGLVFAVLCFFSFDTLSFTGELLASFFVLLALNRLFVEIEFKARHDDNILILGVYLSIATLFVLSYVLFLAGAILMVVIYAGVSVRRLGLLLLGFILPHLALVTTYYFIGHAAAIWSVYYWPNLTWNSAALVSWQSLLWLALFPTVFFVLSLFMLTRQARLTKYQSQLFQVMFWWLIISFSVVLYSDALRPQQFIVLIPSLTYFISHYLLLIRRRWLAELSLWIFIGGVLVTSYGNLYEYFSKVDYTSLRLAEQDRTWSGKRLVMLSERPALQAHSRGVSYFQNPKLAKAVFAQPEYYQNILFIAHAFSTEPPDAVYDPEGLFRGAADRIPFLKESYRADPPFYIRKGVMPDR